MARERKAARLPGEATVRNGEATVRHGEAAVPHGEAAVPNGERAVRIGEAAEMLGVSVETLRRWERDGRIRTHRTDGRQRLLRLDDVQRLLTERRRAGVERPIRAQSARNRFEGIVTRIEVDRVAAVVEVQAGPHRLVSLMTAEAVEDLGLRVGDEAVCVVKATNVVVEVPAR
ncbi:MAG: MerR family DNA-binding transcriptional regulator [Chloroflexi bacterium]|nr:MerR family DNA-binding transcriptional regulator [Chloroflexota bacterium]